MKPLSSRNILSIVPTTFFNFEQRCSVISEVLNAYAGKTPQLIAQTTVIQALLNPTSTSLTSNADRTYDYLHSRNSYSPKTDEIAGISWLILTKHLPPEKRAKIGWEGRTGFHFIVALAMAEPGYDLVNAFSLMSKQASGWGHTLALILALLFKLYPEQIEEMLAYAFAAHENDSIWTTLHIGYDEKLFTVDFIQEVYEVAKDKFPVKEANIVAKLATIINSPDLQAINRKNTPLHELFFQGTCTVPELKSLAQTGPAAAVRSDHPINEFLDACNRHMPVHPESTNALVETILVKSSTESFWRKTPDENSLLKVLSLFELGLKKDLALQLLCVAKDRHQVQIQDPHQLSSPQKRLLWKAGIYNDFTTSQDPEFRTWYQSELQTLGWRWYELVKTNAVTIDDVLCEQVRGPQLYDLLQKVRGKELPEMSPPQFEKAKQLLAVPERLAQLDGKQLIATLKRFPDLLPQFQELISSKASMPPGIIKLVKDMGAEQAKPSKKTSRSKNPKSLGSLAPASSQPQATARQTRPTSPLPRECGFST